MDTIFNHLKISSVPSLSRVSYKEIRKKNLLLKMKRKINNVCHKEKGRVEIYYFNIYSYNLNSLYTLYVSIYSSIYMF